MAEGERKTRFRLGDWLVDPDRSTVEQSGESRPLSGDQLALLLALADSAGDPVDRETLKARIWPDRAAADQELAGAIRALRSTLGDGARNPRYILAVPRRGYALGEQCEPADQRPPAGTGIPANAGRRPLGSRLESLLIELKRRHVLRVVGAYLLGMWVVLQVAEVTFEPLRLPQWWMTALTILAVLGLPIVLVVAWNYDITPGGIVLDESGFGGLHMPRARRAVAPVVLLGVTLMAGVTGYAWLKTIQQGVPESAESVRLEPSPNSIAVLPLDDLSPGGEAGYLGDGLSEELSSDLAKMPGLRVAARTSAFAVGKKGLDVRAIGEELGVRYVLEGSVRREGARVRVTAQLIDAGRDVHLWSETYDGSLDDIFKIQDEITGKITAALKLQLGSGEMTSSAEQLTDNAAAYQLYLEGRHQWRQRNAASLREAIRLFQQAVQLDPNFHRAWSNLAIAYTNLPDYDRSATFEESFELGLAAAKRALEIDPQSSEALLITANYNEMHCNYSEADRQFQRAIELDPRDPTAQHWYGIMLSEAGHTAEALEHIQAAHRIDPMISAVLGIEARLYRNLGDYVRADSLDREAAGLGLYGGSLHRTGMTYLYAGELEKGRQILEQGWTDESPDAAIDRELFLRALDDPAQLKLFENHIGKADESDPYATYDIVEYLAILGSPYLFDYLSDVKCPYLGDSIWSERFREQRKTPEFFELMQRAGIVDYWREHGWPDDCASLDQSLAECP